MIAAAFYPVFVALGLVVAVEDWREKKIRNRWIGAGLLACAAAVGWLLVNTAAGSFGTRAWLIGEYWMPWRYYGALGLHWLLSVACAVALWRFSVWPAGDAKLFCLFSLQLALIDPQLPGFPRLLFLVLLINTFVPAGLLLGAETIARALAAAARAVLAPAQLLRDAKALADRARVRVLELWPWRWNWLALTVNLLVVFVSFRLLQRRLIGSMGGPEGRLLLFVGLALTWGRVSRLLRDLNLGKASLAGLAFGAVLAQAAGLPVARLAREGAGTFVSFGSFMMVVRLTLGAIAARQQEAALAPSDIRAGVLLEEETFRELKKRPGLGRTLRERYSDGLSETEAAAVRAHLEASGPLECRFYRAVPFAIWLFTGALITFGCRTSAAHAVAGWIREAAR